MGIYGRQTHTAHLIHGLFYCCSYYSISTLYIICSHSDGASGAPPAGGPGCPGGLGGRAWYYGAITRTHCDTLLNQHGHDGDFLIRDSETNVSLFDNLSKSCSEKGRLPTISK